MIKQIYFNNLIAKQLIKFNAIKKFERLEFKYQLLAITPRMSETPDSFDSIEIIIKKYNSTKSDDEKLIDITNIIDNYVRHNSFILYTDGSKQRRITL